MSTRVEQIREKLQTGFAPTLLEIEDQSALHAGHAGARSGGGHFAVIIVSDEFAGKKPLERHRMIYRVLGDMMQTDIHALSIKSFTPGEYSESTRTLSTLNP